MNPQQAPQSPDQQQNVPMAVMQPGEKVLFHLKRHPIGLITIYAVSALLLTAVGISLFVVGPSLLPNNKDDITAIGAVIFMALAITIAVFAFIANRVYWGNSWVLTSDSITQIKQTSLFNKHSSQLSLESLEDVSAEKNGILTHIFNYGVLKAETAGEHSKFIFLYCPDPENYAEQVLRAREEFAQGGGHAGHNE